jgi:hypothetical protein
MRYLYYSIWLSIAISFLCIYSIGNAQTVNTGNILSNSTFGTGNTTSTTGWSTDGDDGVHSHGAWNGFPYQTGMDDSGGVLAFEGHEEDNVYQDVDLVDDGHLTQHQMNQGFTSTMAADVWFWNGIENTLTLKQTVTGSDGSVSTQVREINDHDPNRNFNGGTFTNYTNEYIQGSNTQTDITIRTELYNETAGTTYDNYHRGPDVDNVTLNITYQNIPPINEDTQDAIDDIDEDINDIVENIPDDFDWINEDITEIPDFYIPEEEFTLPFDEEFSFDDIYVEEIPSIEEFDMEVFEEIPDMEMVFFEEEFSEPIMVTEEIFTEEFEEDFTEFLEETGMEEEFMEFLEDEGITAEEFFEEITEEEFNDELTEESFEEFSEPLEDIATEEDVQEVASNEEKEVETEVAQNEKEEEQEEKKETESDSEGTEESKVSTESSEEQETVQSEEPKQLDTDDGIATDVAKVETKLKKNLKIIAKQIAKVTKETTKNLSKEDLFFNESNLNTYKNIVFYSAKDIYDNVNMGLFVQIDLSSYSGDIYAGVSLDSYAQNDPVEVHRVKLLTIESKKNKLLKELEILKQ